jgi:type I restriction enzyme, S subunit
VSATASVELGEIMAPKLGTVDPSKYHDEVFDLYSIPAFDKGEPEVFAGREIGSAKQVVEPGDVLLSKIVPHIRRSWIVGALRGRRIIASGEWIVFRNNRFYPQFLRHVIVGDPFHAQFMRTVSGVGGSLLRARPTHVAKIIIHLPPITEQRRIAEVLDRAEALRAKRRAALAQLDTLTQSIFFEIFGDPFAQRANTVRLGDVANILMGQSPPGSSYNTTGKGTPLLNGPTEFGERYPTETQWTTEPTRLCEAGDILFCVRGATAGRLNRADKTYCLGRGLAAIRPLAGMSVNADFLFAVLNRYYGYFQTKGVGSTFININRNELEVLPIPRSQQDKADALACRVGAGEKLKMTHHASLAELDALFASLQHRAFRGEL